MDGWRKRAPNDLHGGGYRAHGVVDALVVPLQGVSQASSRQAAIGSWLRSDI